VAKIILIVIVMLTAKVIYLNLVFVLLLVLCWDRQVQQLKLINYY